MVKLFIPFGLRSICNQRECAELAATSVGEAIQSLEQLHPGCRARLCQGDRLSPGWAVSVNGCVSPLGLRESLRDGDEVHFVTAIGGG